MYIITRSDLSAGMQLAQVAHVAAGFNGDHGEVDDTVIVLKVPNELVLYKHLAELFSHTDRLTWFLEPDLDNALTAVAVGPEAKHLLKKLKLAGT
jgi:hypothetical protein